jgi:hypothetical protein
MTKTLNQIIFFPPPKSEYFFQQHWESEYFFQQHWESEYFFRKNHNLTYITRNSIQAGFACRLQTFRSSNVIFLFVFVCVSVFMNYKVSGVGI